MKTPDKPNDAAVKATRILAILPEDQWRLELTSSEKKKAAGAALALGRLAAAEGDLEEAVKLLGQAASAEVETVTPRALVQLVPVLETLGRRADADQALHDAQVNSNPEHTPDVILDVSAILVSRGQPDRAIQVLRSVIDAWSENARAIDDGAGLARAVAALRLGNLLAKRDGPRSAIPAWELAMAANFPAVTPDAALRLADAFATGFQVGGGRPPAEIEELYQIAIDFDHPTASPEAALKLAEFYLKEEQPQLAAAEYERLIPVGGEVGNYAQTGLAKARAAADPSQSFKQLVRRLAQARSANKGKGKSRERTVIVGAGTGGKYLLRDLDTTRNEVVGWVDDTQKAPIADLPVLGTIDELPRILSSHRIKAVYIAIPTMPGARRRKVVEAALATGKVTVKNLPSMFELLRRRDISRQLRDVRVEETMGEQAMRIDREAGTVVRGRSVMITGAGNTIGAELSRQVAHARARYLSLVDASTMALRHVIGSLEHNRDFEHAFPVLGVCDHVDTMHSALKAHSPAVVFHAAGHGYAPIVEDNPLEAMRTDVIGTWDFARLCGEEKVKRFVFVSSQDAAESGSVFSSCKALAERAISVVASEFPETDFVTVRMGNVYRSAGSVVELFEHQIETGGPITLTSEDATRRFMRVELATQLLLRTARMAKPGGLYALRSDEEVLIKDLAEWMIRVKGHTVDDIGIEITGPRRFEKSLGNPYNALERPIPTDIPEVLEVKPPTIPAGALEDLLNRVRTLVEQCEPVELRELVEGPVHSLLFDGQAVEESEGEFPETVAG